VTSASAALSRGVAGIWPDVVPLAVSVQRIEGRHGRGVGPVPAAAITFQTPCA